MSDSTDRISDSQGTARMDAGTARMDAGTSRIGVSQSASTAAGGTIFADGQTLVLNGRNCVIEKLVSMGSGEAVVYKIQIDDKPYALKHYKPNTPLSDTAKKLLTKIRDNPRDNVVRIIDFGNYNGQDFEIMEYAEGGTLDNYIKKTGGVKDINKIKSIVKQLNEGLQQLHGYYKAIYQDLKPENIFFKDAARSSLVLADFGISSVMQGGSEEVEVTASVTDLYGAPELARKGNNTKVIVTPAVDYFAMGITLYELWLGEQPFKEIKATTRERRIQDGTVDFPIEMPDAFKRIIEGLIEFKPKDRSGNDHIQKWLKGETLSLDKKPSTVASTVYKPLKFGSEVASNPKEMAALMEKNPEAGKVCLYDEFITSNLKDAGDVTLYTEIKNVMSQYGKDQETGLLAAIYTLDPERPFVSRKGKICTSNEEIADAIWDDQAHYMEDLKDPNTGLYIYIAVTGGSQGKEVADNFRKYFIEYPPNRALTLIFLKLQSDGGITIGSKRYLSTDELAQEKDVAQIDLIKKAVREKDSQLLVWISDEYGDYFKSSDEFNKLSIPDQFFLLGLLPFLSYKELTGSNGEAALQDLINYYPGRSDLFEAYVAQGLPLKGQILDSPTKKTPIDYVVRNYNELTKMHNRYTVFNLIQLLHRLGADVNEYSSDGTGPFMNALAKDDDLVRFLSLVPTQLVALLFELGADGDYVSNAGKVCKRGNGEEIAKMLMDEQEHYKRNLKQADASLYLYLAATEGSQGKEFAQNCHKYFNEYTPERALALTYIHLQSDVGITLGSKHYKSLDELAQEKDGAQINLVKKEVTEKDSLLLVWVSSEYEDRFKTTEAYGNLSIPDRFFLLSLFPFLSYKELSGINSDPVSDLRFLIDNVPGRKELFEAYVAQGLPLKGQILDSQAKRTAIDYIVCNFDDIKKHGSLDDTVRNLIRLLHQLGADVNEFSSDNTCPLINAFESFLAGKDDLIKLLLELGADPKQYRELLERQEEKELKEQKEKARLKAEEDERNAEQERQDREERERKRLKHEVAVKRGKIIKLVVTAVITITVGYFIITYVNKVSLYKQATEAFSNGEFESAINNFKTLGDFRDASSMVLYAQAEEALSKEDYTTAIENFKTLQNFLDSEKKLQQTIYINNITTFIADISEKSDRVIIWRNVVNDVLSNVIGTANRHTVALLEDRTVVATGYNKDGRINLSSWRNIIAVSARVEGGHTVGLRTDGTVIAAGYNQDGQCNVSAWRNIKAVSAGEDHSVGLRTDGTVVAVGKNVSKQCNVTGWRNIVAVSAGGSHTVGLQADGTVIAVGSNASGQCNVSGWEWEEIVAVSAGASHTVGIHADGTVIAAGSNYNGQCNVSDWKDIVAVSAGGNYTVGLRADGTVIAVGINAHGQCNVSDWGGIVAVSAGGNHTVGLKADGTVIATGNNAEGQLSVYNWKIDWQKIAIDQAARIK